MFRKGCQFLFFFPFQWVLMLSLQEIQEGFSCDFRQTPSSSMDPRSGWNLVSTHMPRASWMSFTNLFMVITQEQWWRHQPAHASLLKTHFCLEPPPFWGVSESGKNHVWDFAPVRWVRVQGMEWLWHRAFFSIVSFLSSRGSKKSTGHCHFIPHGIANEPLSPCLYYAIREMLPPSL